MSIIKELLAKNKLIVSPTASDVLSALLIEKTGFDICYISGLGVAASHLGVPDIGLITGSEIIERAELIAQAVSIPVICDIDTGYGDAKNVWWTIRRLETAGVSGAQLEDQTLIKRCGYLPGKEVIPVEEYLIKLRAAVDARKRKDFVIVARTDCYDSSGLEEVIGRLNIYADNGADLALSASLHTLDEYKQLAKAVKIPLIAVAPADPTTTTVKQWEETGVSIVIYFGLTLFSSIKAQLRALQTFRNEGSLEKMKNDFISYNEYGDIVKLSQWMKLVE